MISTRAGFFKWTGFLMIGCALLVSVPIAESWSSGSQARSLYRTSRVRLQAADSEAGDRFGYSVAIAGDTAIVGAYGKDTSTGAAYVFARNQGGANMWGQVLKLQAVDRKAGDFFGVSVAIAGGTAIVGADAEGTRGTDAGAAYVFARNQGGANMWGQVAKLQAADGEAGDVFGESVAIAGDTAIVGATLEDTGSTYAGAAYVFARNQGGANMWGQVAKLQAADSAAGDFFGFSVAIAGDTAIVGAALKGAAYVFARNQGGANTWGQVAKLRGVEEVFFGESVAIAGDMAIVGAHLDDGGLAGTEPRAASTGTAHLFARDQGGANMWGRVAKLQAADREAGDCFGRSVAIAGDMAIVGAHGEDTGGTLPLTAPPNAGTDVGAAYVFARDQGEANTWGQVAKLQAADGETGDRSGISVAIAGDTAIVGADHLGACGHDRIQRGVAVVTAGAAYVFDGTSLIADSGPLDRQPRGAPQSDR